VNAAQGTKISVVQRLNADRYPVHARQPISGKSVRLDTPWIGFQRDLGVRRQIPMLTYRFDQCRHRCWLHQRRRPAAKEDALHAPRANARPGLCHLGQIALEKRRLVPAAVAHMAVEVAIRALGRAERPMDVNAERFAQRGQGHSFLKGKSMPLLLKCNPLSTCPRNRSVARLTLPHPT
jgi:hypothetical protein